MSQKNFLEKFPLEMVLSKYLSERKLYYFRNCYPIWYHLIKYDFAVFGCLTFEDERLRRREAFSERQIAFHDLIKRACFDLGIQRSDRKKICFYLKHEVNESFGWHVHFLILNNNLTVAGRSLAATLNYHWNYGTHIVSDLESVTWLGEKPLGKGTCKIQPFDPARKDAGIYYVTKRQYERGELVETKELLSDALKGLLYPPLN